MNAINAIIYTTGLATGTVTALGTLELLEEMDNHNRYHICIGKDKKHKRVMKEMAKVNISATTGLACAITSWLATGTMIGVTKSIIKK